MKRSLKIIAVAVLVVIVVMVGAAVFFTRLAARSPEAVTSAVQNQLREHFPLPISIARARVEWKQGPRVILTNVTIDSPGAITLRVKSITAYLTIWRLIFGDINVNKLRLVEPAGEVDVEGLRRLKLHQASGNRPVVILWKGSVKFTYQGMDFPLTDLSGRITKDWVNLRARTLGGRVLLQADLVEPGKVTFDAYGIPLDRIDAGFKGIAHMSFTIEDTKDTKTGSFSFQAKDLALPCLRGTMSKLIVTAALSGDVRHMNFTDISINTPVITISGKGEVIGLKDMETWQDAVLNLEAVSKDFDYDKVVDALPVQMFPDWLKTLLTKQIRGGRSRFSMARYNGRIKDFLSGENLMQDLYVVQDLNSQSFSTLYAPERITGIQGRVIYGKGDIRLTNISGVVGGSSLKRVDIVFSKVVKPFWHIGVDVDLDMPASDFIRAWRAAMVPQGIYKILNPVTKVKSGQIKALVSTYYDESVKNPFKSKGDIRLTGCTYNWGTHTIADQSGSIHADSFSTPQRIILSGSFDNTHIKRLDVSLVAPFGENLSRYTLIADHLPPMGKIALENSTLKLTGSGKAESLKGSFELNTSSIAYATGGNSFSSLGASIKGDFKAGFEKQTAIDVSNMVIHTSSGSLTGTAGIKPGTGSVTLSGKLNLKDISTRNSRGVQALKGIADGSLQISWGDLTSVQGNLGLSNATLPYQDGLVTINGPLAISTPIISSDALLIASGDTTVTLSGKLKYDNKPYFKGSAVIKGLGTGDGGASLKGLEGLQAEASLKFVDCIFLGLPVENATAQADLKDGILSLSGVELETVSGTAKGAMNIGVDGSSTFDMMVSIQGADMRKLLRATHIKSVIDGTLDLHGRIFGQTDSLNGTLTIAARDGEIRKYTLVSQIFSLLNVYKIIQNRDIDFLSNHFTYNRISSTMNIKDNVVDFDDFALESNSIQISAVGKYALKTKKIDAHIGIQPLESVDWTISKIPLVGWVLTGDKGKMIVVSMGLKGTMDEPKVRLEPVNTLSNTVAASLLRSLKLPGRLIDEALRLIGEKAQ